MMHRFDLPEVTPIFPLSGAVLLPRSTLPLHISEPRYLAMVDDAMKSQSRLIGMLQPAADDALYSVGCAGRISQFNELDDGRYMIVLTGISRFNLGDNVHSFTPYQNHEITWGGYEDDLGAAQTDPNFDRDGFFIMLKRYFTQYQMTTDWEALTKAENELLIDSLSMLCPFADEEKQALLEADTLPQRREILTTLIEYALHSSAESEPLQ